MSHPVPGHYYGENEEGNKTKRLAPSKLKAYSHKLMRDMGVTTHAKHQALLKKKEVKKLPRSKHIDHYKNDEGYRDDQE